MRSVACKRQRLHAVRETHFHHFADTEPGIFLSVRLSHYTYLILEFNAALDTGKYDHVTMEEARDHIEKGDLFDWLRKLIGQGLDLSLYKPEELTTINDQLNELLGGYYGREGKWGVENRGLCLLVAWVTELVQQKTA